MTARVLVVEDEADLADLLVYSLNREHFAADAVATGEDAVRRLARDPRPNLVLLDRMLPDLSGDRVLERMRADPATRGVPVIVLTARDAEPERIEGFALGADDYVVKPFSVRELILRIRAILRRAEQGAALVVDADTHTARVGNRPIDLTPLEVGLLAALRDGAVWTRTALVERAWSDPYVDVEVVDSAVKRLRRKLEPLGLTIGAVRNVGFRLEAISAPSS